MPLSCDAGDPDEPTHVDLLLKVYVSTPYVWIQGYDKVRHKTHEVWFPPDVAEGICKQISAAVDASDENGQALRNAAKVYRAAGRTKLKRARHRAQWEAEKAAERAAEAARLAAEEAEEAAAEAAARAAEESSDDESGRSLAASVQPYEHDEAKGHVAGDEGPVAGSGDRDNTGKIAPAESSSERAGPSGADEDAGDGNVADHVHSVSDLVGPPEAPVWEQGEVGPRPFHRDLGAKFVDAGFSVYFELLVLADKRDGTGPQLKIQLG